jgi:hypothetical protein
LPVRKVRSRHHGKAELAITTTLITFMPAYRYAKRQRPQFGRFGRWLTAPITLIRARGLCCHAPARLPSGSRAPILGRPSPSVT